MDRISKVMGERQALSLYWLPVPFRVVRSEEARLSEEQQRAQNSSIESERQAELLRPPFPYAPPFFYSSSNNES